jgi:hypothetical protein
MSSQRCAGEGASATVELIDAPHASCLDAAPPSLAVLDDPDVNARMSVDSGRRESREIVVIQKCYGDHGPVKWARAADGSRLYRVPLADGPDAILSQADVDAMVAGMQDDDRERAKAIEIGINARQMALLDANPSPFAKRQAQSLRRAIRTSRRAHWTACCSTARITPSHARPRVSHGQSARHHRSTSDGGRDDGGDDHPDHPEAATRAVGAPPPPSGTDPSQYQRALDIIRRELWYGPRRTRDIEQALGDEGISERTANRARRNLRVVAIRAGFGPNGAWLMALPAPATDWLPGVVPTPSQYGETREEHAARHRERVRSALRKYGRPAALVGGVR